MPKGQPVLQPMEVWRYYVRTGLGAGYLGLRGLPHTGIKTENKGGSPPPAGVEMDVDKVRGSEGGVWLESE